MKAPRGLTPAERAAWARLAATVVPIAQSDPPPPGEVASRRDDGGGVRRAAPAPSTTRFASGPPPPRGEVYSGLDASWDRRLRAGSVAPDVTLDLHGLTLDGAHRRLEAGLAQARGMGARLVLVVTGKPRPAESADRGERRGAIRAKVVDWLAAGPHGGAIAAIRQAHRRHGGDGALYLVLRRER